MRKTILLLTDFSENARNALVYALSMYGESGCDFVLFHALVIPVSVADVGTPYVPSMLEKPEQNLNDIASGFRPLLEKNNSTITTKITSGTGVSELIEKAATEINADLIIMGSHGHKGLLDLVMGPTAESVIQRSTHPLLIIPPGAAFHPIHKVLFAADLKRINLKKKLAPFVELATKNKAHITFLTVKETGEKTNPDEAWQSLDLHNLLPECQHKFEILEGTETHLLIENYAARSEMDLLVAVARDRGFWASIFHKSISSKLAEGTQVPLLVLHDEA